VLQMHIVTLEYGDSSYVTPGLAISRQTIRKKIKIFRFAATEVAC
jgi:hypothetical protein